MWRVALLWDPLGRSQSGRLAWVLPTVRTTMPRVLLVILLVGALVVVGPAAAESGSEVVGRGPALAHQLFSTVTHQLAVGSEASCQSLGWTPPLLGMGDEGPAIADLRGLEPSCDD